MGSWIEMKRVVIVPDYWLYSQREGAKMTLVYYSSNQLQDEKSQKKRMFWNFCGNEISWKLYNS